MKKEQDQAVKPKTSGGQPGNNNAASPFRGALLRALARKHGTVEKGLNKIADCIVAEAVPAKVKGKKPKYEDIMRAIGGTWKARDTIADRLDGKPRQSVEHSGPGGGDIPVAVQIEYA